MKKTALFIIVLIIVGFAAGVYIISNTQTKKPEALPDLAVVQVKAVVPAVKKVKTIKVRYVVQNQGKAAAAASISTVSLFSENGQLAGKVSQINVPPLPAGGSYTAEISYPIVAKGRYSIKAVADYNDRIYESNESNNYNVVKLGVGIKL